MLNKMMLDLFYNAKNTGRISKPDGIADMYNEDESQHVEFSLRVDSGIIIDCKFRAQASPYYTAICAKITEMVKGKMISMFFLDPYTVKKELEDESDNNIDFCIECMSLAISDYKEKLAKNDN